MKFFATLLAGLTSATSIEGHLRNQLLPEETGLATVSIKNGVCQAYDGFTVFNLKTFLPGLATGSKIPLHIAETGAPTTKFVFNLCAIQGAPGSKSLEQNWDKSATQGKYKKANALWIEEAGVTHSFSNGAVFDGMDNAAGANTGFHLTWTSDDATCVGTAKAKEAFTVRLENTCDKTATTETNSMTVDGCTATWARSGADGCGTAIPIDKYIKTAAKFIGFIMVGLGVVMTFAGARFLEYLGAALVGFFVAMVVFGIGFNVLPSSAHLGLLIVLLIIALVLGAVAAKLLQTLIRKWVVPIMGAGAGAAGLLLLGGVLGLDNKFAKIGMVFLGLVGGFVLGMKLNNPVKTFGTAFVGAFFVVRGLATFLGGWPGDSDAAKHALKHHSKKIFLYLGVFVVLFVGGALVQLRTVRDDDVDKDDEFATQDEARTCGCF